MIEVTSLCGQQINLGKQGENLARIVYFDELSSWKEMFGEGVCELIHQRNGDVAPYPVVLNVENDRVCWNVTASDTAIVGDGKCELRYIVNDVVVKSKTFTTTVISSLGDEVTEAPEPYQNWVNDVLGAAAKVEETEKDVLALKEDIEKTEKEISDTAKDVKEIAVHQPIIVQNNWWVWDAEKGNYVDTGVRATFDIAQTTGDSETEVMSQKATTEEIKKVANKVAKSPATVTVYADRWESYGEGEKWQQEVVVANATVTEHSQIDLKFNDEQATIFKEKDVAFQAVNFDGVVVVRCYGKTPPKNDYIFEASVSEVIN